MLALRSDPQAVSPAAAFLLGWSIHFKLHLALPLLGESCAKKGDKHCLFGLPRQLPTGPAWGGGAAWKAQLHG